MITVALQKEIETQIHDKITSIVPLSAANNAQIYRLKLASNRHLVVKVAERGLDTEAFMLKYLREKSKLPVPQVFYSNEHIIAMEYLAGMASTDDASQRHAAELLAELHGVTSEHYGFIRDTVIGSLPQPNPQMKDWPAFFAEHRLLFMTHEAHKEGKLDAKAVKMAEKLAGKLPHILRGAAAPGLIHGDVWSGNVLSERGKMTAFLDPAIYYADPEIELAFIRLLNTFGQAFFSRYNDIRPIRAGFFEERADIYALYPLLVHTRLFGFSYARKAIKILEKYA